MSSIKRRAGRALPASVTALATAAALLSTTNASGADCSPNTGLASCIDADAAWLVPTPSRFVSIPRASPDPRAPISVGLALGYVSRPVVLTAPSPDPAGREIDVIDDAVGLSLLWGYAPLDRLELGAALPATIQQSGSGPGAVTTQAASPLPPTALRDPRLSASFTLLPETGPAALALASRLTVSLPLGQEDRLAGDRSFVMAPSLVLQMRTGAFFAGSELGARLRQPTEFGGARVGSQLECSVGLGADLFESGLLSLALETWMLPTLVSQTYAIQGPRAREDATLVPAEWLASVRSALFAGQLVAQLGAGSGIPLSSERLAGDRTEQSAGMTTPKLRIVAVLRYAPKLEPDPP